MAKVTFFSNYLNHHQLSFCKQLDLLTNHDFKFVSQKAISEKRIAFGYKNISNDYDFVVRTYEDDKYLKEAYELADNSRYVLFGSSNTDYLKSRLKDNKLTIKYSERLFKKKLNLKDTIKAFYRVYVNHGKYRNKNLYMLCSGAYAAYDFNRFGAYKNKTYKWAYFPETIKYDINELIKSKEDEKINILWAGRFLNWKHPDLAVKLAIKLLKEGYKNFKVTLIGNGEMEDSLKKMIKENNLSDYVFMPGSMHPEDVRKKMEKANIFLFTSDMQEGWGAVLSEAMNSGCACVSSHAIGSTGFLIQHGENGLIYKDGDFDDLFEKVKTLIDDKNSRECISKEAYLTMFNTWNAEVAAKRFMILCEALEKGEDTPFNDGPCSKAYSICDKDMYKYLVDDN